MRILVVAPVLPHRQARHAGGHFLHAHLTELAVQGDEVTLLCLDNRGEDSDHLDFPPGVEVVVAPVGPVSSSTERAVHDLRSRVHRDVLSGPALRGLIDSGLISRSRSADMIELHWTACATLVPLLRRRGVTTPVSVVAHDVGAQADRDRIRRYGSSRARLAGPLLDRLRDRNEASDLSGADLVLVFKVDDEPLLRRMGVRSEVHLIEPSLDMPPSDSEVVRGEGEVLFTGALWRRENVEAVSWLLDDIWPRVLGSEPTARLTIAGAGAPPELTARANTTDGVYFTGEVDDLGEFYARADVFLAPLVIGGGLKFKVPQAMVWGLPVVASTVAAQGVSDAAPPGVFWAVTDDPDELARATADALRHPDRAAQVGAEAARWATSHYAFDRSVARLRERYRQLATGREAPT